MDIQALTHNIGGIWRNGRGSAPCPICQPERRRDQAALSIAGQGGKLLLHCFKSGCSFVDITNAAGAPLDLVQVDFEAQKMHERKQADWTAKVIGRARAIWNQGQPIQGTHGEAYLRARGITCDLPDSLRWRPDIYHKPSGGFCAAMVADVSTGGVHRTFFTKMGERLTQSAKMMLGPCGGGAVRLTDTQGPFVVCEGIETGLALLSGLLSGSETVWAALSTYGIKSLILPDAPHKLTIATDGDEAGKEAGAQLATRATALGWDVSILPAPRGHDWADVLNLRG